MRTASVTEAKTSLSEYLAFVKRSGDGVLITDRGTIVARISPARRSDTTEDIRMQQLELAGLVKVGKGSLPADFWEMPFPRDRNSAAVMALIAEREDGL